MKRQISINEILKPRIFWFLRLPSKGRGGKMVLVGSAIAAFIIVMTIMAPSIAPHNPSKVNVGPIASAPSLAFPMGTNHLGEDIFSRIIFGGSNMIQVAILSVALCLAAGVPLGLISGYSTGFTDRIISLAMDSLYAFPGLVLAIAISATLGTGVLNLAIAIAVVYIPSYFRVVRSQVLTIKEAPYIEAVKAAGGGVVNVLFRQILPNVVPSIVVILSLNVADAILTEAGLTYLGLGPNVSLPDWGWDIYYGKNLFYTGAWWAWVFPGLMILLLATAFTFIGEGLAEIWNPKLSK